MPRIIIFCVMGVLFSALGLNSVLTGKVLTRSGVILLGSSPSLYWVFIAVYAVGAVLGFYRAVTAYKLWRRNAVLTC